MIYLCFYRWLTPWKKLPTMLVNWTNLTRNLFTYAIIKFRCPFDEITLTLKIFWIPKKSRDYRYSCHRFLWTLFQQNSFYFLPKFLITHGHCKYEEKKWDFILLFNGYSSIEKSEIFDIFQPHRHVPKFPRRHERNRLDCRTHERFVRCGPEPHCEMSCENLFRFFLINRFYITFLCNLLSPTNVLS